MLWIDFKLDNTLIKLLNREFSVLIFIQLVYRDIMQELNSLKSQRSLNNLKR